MTDLITTSFFTHYLENNNEVYKDLLEDRVVFVVLSKIKSLLNDKSTKNFKVKLSITYALDCKIPN